MKLAYVLAAALVVGCTGAQAQELDVGSLARQAHLSERQIRMVLGAPVAFAEYRSSYRDARDRLRRAVGGRAELERLALRYAEKQQAIASR